MRIQLGGLVQLFVMAILTGPSMAGAVVVDGAVNYGEVTVSKSSSLAGIQRGWWDFVRTESDGTAASLAQVLVRPDLGVFSRQCRNPIVEGDFERLSLALARIAVTGLPSSPADPKIEGPRGRFLACLNNSGLETASARIESHLWTMTRPDAQASAVICDWRIQSSGPTPLTAFYQFPTRTIWWQWSSRPPGTREPARADPGVGERLSESDFANLLFEQLMHVAEMFDPPLVQAAQACCGDAAADRTGACDTLDGLVARERRVLMLAQLLGWDGVLEAMETDLDSAHFEALVSAFYRDLAGQLGELVMPVTREECLHDKGREACTRRLESAAKGALARALEASCAALTPRNAGVNACANVTEGMRADVVNRTMERLLAPRANLVQAQFLDEDGNSVAALHMLERCAAAGDVLCEHALGVAYLNGLGVAQDVGQGMFWLERAAQKAHAPAIGEIGWAMLNETDVAGRHQQAMSLLRHAASEGHVDSQKRLALAYAGLIATDSVTPDEAEVVRWLAEAARQGDAFATAQLGERLATGRGIARDPVEALRLLLQVADAPNALVAASLEVLADLFLAGDGTPRDPAAALVVMLIGVDAGASALKPRADALRPTLTADETARVGRIIAGLAGGERTLSEMLLAEPLREAKAR